MAIGECALLNHRPVYSYLLTVLTLLLAVTTMSLAAVGPVSGIPPSFPDSVEAEKTAVSPNHALYLPLIATPPEPPPWVDTQNRATVRDYYLTIYQASEGVSPGWTGHHASCNPGTTTAAFKEAVALRINYFRQMAGMPSILGFKDEYNQKAQAAALMMSVNRNLSHTPPPSWLCYTDDGYSGASSSNLYLGIYGPAAISGYVLDPGSGNYFVGHRRWILYPQTRYMGTGDVPPQSGYPAGQALWVFDHDNMWGSRPDTREPFVAWPPPGYVPYQVVYPRWSFAYAGADFASATVTMTRNGQPIGTTVSPVVNGFGENTLVWELSEAVPQPPDNDIIYDVTVHNVVINGQPQQFSYAVIIFNPTP
jgi:uncharacterized protein YkwD